MIANRSVPSLPHVGYVGDVGYVGVLSFLLSTASLRAQSTHLLALEGSAPASVVEPLVPSLQPGLGDLWIDPTADSRVVGLFFGVSESNFASVRIYHGVAAFTLGPRWSLVFGQSDVPNLFDSSLVNADPGLVNLQARAWLTGIDVTERWNTISGSLGLAVVGDDNVGDVQTSTIARLRLRYAFLPGLSLRLGTDRAVGGSLQARSGGSRSIELSAGRRAGVLAANLSLAHSQGSVWRQSETSGAWAGALGVTVAEHLYLSAGAARYSTTFGVGAHQWSRTAGAGISVGDIRVWVRYTSTRLGGGSGRELSLSYEP